MPEYTTPGVYVEEIPPDPHSVVEVETAVPAFIGCTERAVHDVTGQSLSNRPTRIRSLAEYEDHFGDPHAADVTVAVTRDAAGKLSARPARDGVPAFLLHHAVRMYFDNGGGPCHVVSVGDYAAGPPTLAALTGGLAAVALEDEPTLIVVPEAVTLPDGDCATLARAILEQCGERRDRFALLDLKHGASPGYRKADVDAERGGFGARHLEYGAAYYPFLRTSLHPFVNADQSNVQVAVNGRAAAPLGALAGSDAPLHGFVLAELEKRCLVMPPSGAIAGVYAATDARRGVWKAPANVALADVIAPHVPLDDRAQGELNLDADTGKSINAVRAFAGKGTLVWGARTLLGNDAEWRYVPVRRLLIVVEQSVRKSLQWVVFEPNDANVWARVRRMIENYLTDKWQAGALAGSKPAEAFRVGCGLGSTMTAQDVLEGRLNVEIGLAVLRPGEFIVLRFSVQVAGP